MTRLVSVPVTHSVLPAGGRWLVVLLCTFKSFVLSVFKSNFIFSNYDYNKSSSLFFPKTITMSLTKVTNFLSVIY